MTTERRFQIIRQAVLEVAGFAGDVAERLDQAQPLAAGDVEALAALQDLALQVQGQRAALARYLHDHAGGAAGEAGKRPVAASGLAMTFSAVLRDLSLALQRCALGTSMMYEVALRLYEPPLRAIALEQMNAQADAALAVARLLPGVVAAELAEAGLDCACACPICGVGACGCVSWGTEAMVLAWRAAAAKDFEPVDFVLLPPRPESPLSRVGAQSGDLILAVDGQRLHGRQAIQDALRRRKTGDELTVLLQRDAEAPREVRLRHAGDYS